LDCNAIIEVELEPMRQAANILCLSQKADLLNKDFREAVCAVLRPAYIAKILNGYTPDNFDKTKVQQTLIDKIAQQDSTYIHLPNSYEPKQPLPLHFNFVMDKLKFDRLEIPKVILDKPAFSFLKRGTNGLASSDCLKEGDW